MSYDRGYGAGWSFGRWQVGYDAEMRPRGYDTGLRGWGGARPGNRGGAGGPMRHGRWQPQSPQQQGGFGRGYGYGYDRGGEGGRGHFGRGMGGGGYPERGVYGESYPGFGGYPGARERGMYGGWDSGSSANGPWGRGRSGYDGGGWGGEVFQPAREPFVPEEAYHSHPEMMARPHHWDETQQGGVETDGEEMDDGEVYQAVRARLLGDRYLDANRIQVMVKNGVVTLEGEVDDFMEARYAWDDAWETDGVRGVVTRLAVRTDQPHVSHNDEFPQSAG